LIQSDGQNWFLDGESRTSPVNSIRLKAKKLADEMKQKLGVEYTTFIPSFVVMHGKVER